MEHQWDDDGERCLKCGDKDWFAAKECRGEMRDVLNVADHFALSCKCGCVHFHLLKSSVIECSGCRERFGWWTKEVAPTDSALHQPGGIPGGMTR